MPATTVRPGDVIKRILNGELPIAKQVLEAGEVVERLVAVSQASVGELHRAYKRQIKAEQLEMVGRRRTKQRGMCYDTFRKRTWEAWQLGLIEPVEEGDPIPVGQGFLLSTRGAWPNARVVQSVAISYALTNLGRQEEDAWLDLTTAFKDSVPAGGRSEVAAAPVASALPDVPTISLPASFGIRSVPRLVNHLQVLAELAEEQDWPEQAFPALQEELDAVIEAGVAWRDSLQDSLDDEQGKDRPSEEREETLEGRLEGLDEYLEGLQAQDIQQGIDALEGLE